jgi:amino acid transporter
LSPTFFQGLGAAVLFAMYDYQGYFTVCLIGDEVRTPQTTMPRSILISILVLAACYLAMSFSVIGVVPWREAMHSSSVVADVMVRVYGPLAGKITAVLIMLAAFGSVFTVLLGFSRVPFAAAVRGEFFSVFARVHPKGFPSFAVVSLGLASAVACLLPLERLINALLVIQIVSQFIAQCVAVVLIRRYRKDIDRPFSMYLYPLPVVIAIAGWLLILSSSQTPYLVAGVVSLLAGVAAFLVKSRNKREWPFT